MISETNLKKIKTIRDCLKEIIRTDEFEKDMDRKYERLKKFYEYIPGKKDITPTVVAVYTHILLYEFECPMGYYCRSDRSQIAKYCACSVHTTSKVIKILKRHNLIEDYDGYNINFNTV